MSDPTSARRREFATVLAELRRCAGPDAAPEPDPVATFNAMRDAATHLGAVLAQRITVGGRDDPAMVEMAAWKSRVDAIDYNDMAAQQELTTTIVARRRELQRGG